MSRTPPSAILGIWHDPEGRLVIIDEGCWYRHILVIHSEVPQNLFWVEATIVQPDGIYQSAKSGYRCYYRQGLHPVHPLLFSKVVVQALYTETSEVRTAHFVSKIHRKETKLWP